MNNTLKRINQETDKLKKKIQNKWKKSIEPPKCMLSSNKSPRKVTIKETSISNAQTNIFKDAEKDYTDEINISGAYDLGAKCPIRKKLYRKCENLIYKTSELKKHKSYSGLSTNSGLSDQEKNDMNVDCLLRQLQKERNTMAKLGFIEKAEELDTEINYYVKKAKKQRKEEEEELLNEQLLIWNNKSTRRKQRLENELESEKKQLHEKHNNEIFKLTNQQKNEFIKLLEDTQKRAIGKIKECNCKSWYLCKHNKSASYNTRKPKPEVVTYKKNSKRLKNKGQTDEANIWEAKAFELDDYHQEEWRSKISQSISTSSWGPNDSICDKLIERHKHNILILKKTHEVDKNVLHKKHQRRQYILENIINADKNRIKVQVHKEYLKIIEERNRIATLEENNNNYIENDLFHSLKNNENKLFEKKIKNNEISFQYDDSVSNYWNNFQNRTSETWVPPTNFGLEYSQKIF